MPLALTLAGLHTDPNAFSYPAGDGQTTVSGSGLLAGDKQLVASLLAKAKEGLAGAKTDTSVEGAVQRLVKSTTAMHALTRKLHFLTDETDAEKLGRSCELLGKSTEAAARTFAHKTGVFSTSAVPPHDVLLTKFL